MTHSSEGERIEFKILNINSMYEIIHDMFLKKNFDF